MPAVGDHHSKIINTLTVNLWELLAVGKGHPENLINFADLEYSEETNEKDKIRLPEEVRLLGSWLQASYTSAEGHVEQARLRL